MPLFLENLCVSLSQRNEKTSKVIVPWSNIINWNVVYGFRILWMVYTSHMDNVVALVCQFAVWQYLSHFIFIMRQTVASVFSHFSLVLHGKTKSNRFGITQGWVHDDSCFIFGETILLIYWIVCGWRWKEMYMKQMMCLSWHLSLLFGFAHETPNATHSLASVPTESKALCSLSKRISVISAIGSHVTELKPDSYVRWCPDHQTWMTPLCSPSLTLFFSPPQCFPSMLCVLYWPFWGKFQNLRDRSSAPRHALFRGSLDVWRVCCVLCDSLRAECWGYGFWLESRLLLSHLFHPTFFSSMPLEPAVH